MLRRTIGPVTARVVVAFAGALLAMCAPRAASAQAFLPPAGEGNVTVYYQESLTRGHVNNFGELVDEESSQAHSLMLDAEFGLSKRLAVNVSLPFIVTRFLGPFRAEKLHNPLTDLDDGTYHGTFQDFRVAVRFNVLPRPIAITPFVEAVVPSHHYVSLGHSVAGPDLRSLALGAAVGGFADAILPGLYYQSQFSYTLVEEVLDIRTNRSRVDSEVGYFVTPRLALRFLAGFQRTHDGLDKLYTRETIGLPGTIIFQVHSRPGDSLTIKALLNPTEAFLNHDRLLRSGYLTLGGGITFAVTDSLDIFAAASNMVWERNVHPLRALSVGANWHFRMHRAAPPASSQRTGRAIPRSNAGWTPPAFH